MQSADRPHRVLVIGFGYAGQRFVRATRHLEREYPGWIALAGVCDMAASARERAAEITQTFESIDDAMTAVRPDVIIVTVNEEAHAEVLHRIAPYAPQVILCEKPLTVTVEEAEALPPAIAGAQLSVNFVERLSPVLDDWFSWAETRPSLTPLRVEFFWGKHRIADPRPTMGVLSEIAHPLDLIDYLFGFERFEIVHAYGLESDYSPHQDASLDTLSLVARTEAFAVVGVSSFVWPRRHRGISALLVDDEGLLSRLTVDFDDPRWDCDRLRVERVDPATGRCETLVERRVDDADVPEAVRGVSKVASFIRDSLVHAEGGRRAHTLVDYEQALKIQRVLGVLDGELHQERISRFSIVGGAGLSKPANGIANGTPLHGIRSSPARLAGAPPD